MIGLVSPEARPALAARQRQIALAFAGAMLPGGRIFPPAGPTTVERLEQMLATFGSRALTHYGRLLDAFEHSTRFAFGARFTHLTPAQRAAALEHALTGNLLQRTLLFALGLPLKNAYFADPELFRKVGCVWDRSGRPEPARWRQQVRRGVELEEDDIECDVVVVGTGAGGAVAAKELAEAGLAVVMVEEGEYFTRADFNGRGFDCMGKLYRGPGETVSIGNTMIVIPLGCTVGGSTTVNSGTCFRTPEWVLEHWAYSLGLDDLRPRAMAPYFEKVEQALGVSEARAEHLGAVARIIARGCDRLGWSHHPLRRNAPECDGQGVCVFGCPTDAKRSTNVSYVPAALERAAFLVTGVRAERVLLEGERAAGVEGRVLGSTRRIRVRGRAVVLACGALLTPAFLLRQGLLRDNRNLGRHLTIHPALAATGMFAEEVRGYASIPQGYCVDHFHREGILMEGSSASFDTGAQMFNLVGRELMEVMESYDRVASFGAMVCEKEGAGRVRLIGGRPVIQYWVSRDVAERLHRAMAHIGRIFFSAGASRVFPAMQRIKEFRSAEEIERFALAPPRVRDFILTAYHPLGTCRIGRDADTAVVDSEHQAFGVPGLYIIDGSNVPTSPTVNPQITIMALATRAAERLANRLA